MFEFQISLAFSLKPLFGFQIVKADYKINELGVKVTNGYKVVIGFGIALCVGYAYVEQIAQV